MKFPVCTAAVCGLLLVPCCAQASIITLTPSEVVKIARDQTSQSNRGTFSNIAGTYGTRERRTDSQTNLQGMTYFKFDLSGLTAAQVNDASFSATFSIDYTSRVNAINAMGVKINVVDDANVWSDSVGSYPLATWLSGDDISGTLPGDHLVVANVVATAPGPTITFDVTQDVKDWVNGVKVNNGYVIFGDRDDFQGAGFENAKISADVIPEPSTYIVFTGLILCFGLAGWWRKRRQAA